MDKFSVRQCETKWGGIIGLEEWEGGPHIIATCKLLMELRQRQLRRCLETMLETTWIPRICTTTVKWSRIFLDLVLVQGECSYTVIFSPFLSKSLPMLNFDFLVCKVRIIMMPNYSIMQGLNNLVYDLIYIKCLTVNVANSTLNTYCCSNFSQWYDSEALM